jgi:uncharacterized RDD family membrane protein YckC
LISTSNLDPIQTPAAMSDPINPYAPPQVDILPPVDPSKNERLASPWRRLGASLLDTLILLVINLPLMWITGYFTRAYQQAAQGNSGAVGLEQVVWAAVGLILMVMLNWNHLAVGETIGKRALGLRIVRKNGEAVDRNHIILRRMLPLQIVVLIPYLGTLLALIDSLLIFRSAHNTLHDDIADTKVVDLRPVGA